MNRQEEFLSVIKADPDIAAVLAAMRSFDAPLGLEDIFNRVLRPNPLWAGPPRAAYEDKCARYRRDWPSVRIMSP